MTGPPPDATSPGPAARERTAHPEQRLLPAAGPAEAPPHEGPDASATQAHPPVKPEAVFLQPGSGPCPPPASPVSPLPGPTVPGRVWSAARAPFQPHRHSPTPAASGGPGWPLRWPGTGRRTRSGQGFGQMGNHGQSPLGRHVPPPASSLSTVYKYCLLGCSLCLSWLADSPFSPPTPRSFRFSLNGNKIIDSFRFPVCLPQQLFPRGQSCEVLALQVRPRG